MILKSDRNCWSLSEHTAAGLLVDSRDYYKAFYESAERAERRILIAGWQFDSRVPLLRGEDASGAEEVRLLPFLELLTRRKPGLEIFILAWDYSVVYALEREWMQRLTFDFKTNARIHFEFDGKHSAGASHHQKFVVIDGQLAFVGGIDLCDSRWDDRRHAPDNPQRVNLKNEPQKPYHDMMAFVAGNAAAELERLFTMRWQLATSDELKLGSAPRFEAPPFRGAIPVRCGSVAISRTRGEESELGLTKVEEIVKLYVDAIASAESLIYIETQYFTTRAVHAALIARMRDKRRSSLSIVLVMPRGADSPKEDLVLGQTQNALLTSLCRAAQEHGHELRAYYSSFREPEREVATFIHSKLLIVDDRLLSIGSANLTNRSMHLDSELNLTWECEASEGPLFEDVRRTRASLLAEHTGIEKTDDFEDRARLVERLDALANSPENRLRPQPLSSDGEASEADALLLRAFDPEQPLDDVNLAELLGMERLRTVH